MCMARTEHALVQDATRCNHVQFNRHRLVWVIPDLVHLFTFYKGGDRVALPHVHFTHLSAMFAMRLLHTSSLATTSTSVLRYLACSTTPHRYCDT